jgi:hypothetical protein
LEKQTQTLEQSKERKIPKIKIKIEEFFSFVLDITFLCRLRICTMEMDQEHLVEI